MWYKFISIFLILISTSIGFAQLQSFSLEGKVITSLAAEHQDFTGFGITQSIIIAGTDENGIYKTSYLNEQPDWISLGLSDKTITALSVQHWGAGPADGLTLYAAVVPELQQGDSTLINHREVYLSMDTLWTPADSGIDRENLSRVNAINAYYFTGHTPPQPLLMGGEFGLYQGTPFGWFWMESNIEAAVKINSIDVNPHWFGNLAWAAGSYGLSPAAFRSNDQGANWQVFLLPSLIEGEALSVAINPRYPDSVYISLAGAVLVTPDSGNTWSNVLCSEDTKFSALAVDPLFSENVFAGGIKDSNQFILYHSSNGGNTWTMTLPVTAVYIAGVSSIIAVHTDLANKQGLIFIGTLGTGVWRYKYSPATDIKDDSEISLYFYLSQNYPNPFNPSTSIQYAVGSKQFVTLKVYDVLGNEIATLVNEEKQPGVYEVEFQSSIGSRQLASGIYFYQIKADDFVQMKKMILLK